MINQLENKFKEDKKLVIILFIVGIIVLLSNFLIPLPNLPSMHTLKPVEHHDMRYTSITQSNSTIYDLANSKVAYVHNSIQVKNKHELEQLTMFGNNKIIVTNKNTSFEKVYYYNNGKWFMNSNLKDVQNKIQQK